MPWLTERIKWAWKHRLHVFVFLSVFGSTPIVHARMVAQGVPDSLALWVAIAAVDAIVVMAGGWGVTGLCIAFVLFVAVVGVTLNAQPTWTPALFSLTAFLGTVGNVYMAWSEEDKQKRAVKAAVASTVTVGGGGRVDWAAWRGKGADKLRSAFNLSWSKARALKKMLDDGKEPDPQWLLENAK